MRTVDRISAISEDQPPARQDTVELIRSTGLQLIYEQGYEGMTLRGLASRAGIGQSTLYGHYSSKQHLLVDLICLHMEELLSSLYRAVPADGAPLDRYLAFVRFHVIYHIRRRREVFICYSELRSLEPQNYRRVTACRKEYERVLTRIIESGVAAGTMRRLEPRVTAYAILAMLSGITTWYREDGPLSEDEICRTYTELAISAVIDPLGLALTRPAAP